jgi:hypothetical protein
LHDYLVSLFNSIPADNWPHTLYLQVDNCWRENKNTTMLHYLGLLLHFGWFKTIEMYSLSPSHTYEDIDQIFSTWNIHYWNSSLQSSLAVSDFLKWAYKSDATKSAFKMVHFMYAMKS